MAKIMQVEKNEDVSEKSSFVDISVYRARQMPKASYTRYSYATTQTTTSTIGQIVTILRELPGVLAI